MFEPEDLAELKEVARVALDKARIAQEVLAAAKQEADRTFADAREKVAELRAVEAAVQQGGTDG